MNPVFPSFCLLLQSSSRPLNNKHVLIIWWGHVHIEAMHILWVRDPYRVISFRNRVAFVSREVISGTAALGIWRGVRGTLIDVSEAPAAPSSGQPMREYITHKMFLIIHYSRSQWPRGLRRGSAAARLLGLWVRIPPGAWMFVCCECYVLSGRSLCDELVTRPEESYRLWCVVVCGLETSWMRRPWHTGGLEGGGGVAPKTNKLFFTSLVPTPFIPINIQQVSCRKACRRTLKYSLLYGGNPSIQVSTSFTEWSQYKILWTLLNSYFFS